METNNKLREALEAILGIADHVQTRFAIPKLANQEISELKQIASAALAEPVKNYEVGTAEEQAERFVDFCDEEKGNREHCRNCSLCNAQDCTLAWAQTPYEGGAK